MTALLLIFHQDGLLDAQLEVIYWRGMSSKSSVPHKLSVLRIDSWLGKLYVATTRDAVKLVALSSKDVLTYVTSKSYEASSEVFELAEDASAQLIEYLSGTRTSFRLPLDPDGTTFQKTVWKEVMKIPYAETSTYSEIARRIGCPRAQRAVGLALKENPLMIIIPCHRIIRKDGSLGGYSPGERYKMLLLSFERKNALTFRQRLGSSHIPERVVKGYK